jgi:hypothetical protein
MEESMAARDLTPPTAACRACGAYGSSQHRPTCQPDRRFKLGRMRGARRDSRNSAAARANDRIQNALLRGLSAQQKLATRAR